MYQTNNKYNKCMNFTNNVLTKHLKELNIQGRSKLLTKDSKCNFIVQNNIVLPVQNNNNIELLLENDKYVNCIQHTSCQLTEHLRNSNVYGRSGLTNKHLKCEYIINNDVNLPIKSDIHNNINFSNYNFNTSSISNPSYNSSHDFDRTPIPSPNFNRTSISSSNSKSMFNLIPSPKSISNSRSNNRVISSPNRSSSSSSSSSYLSPILKKQSNSGIIHVPSPILRQTAASIDITNLSGDILNKTTDNDILDNINKMFDIYENDVKNIKGKNIVSLYNALDELYRKTDQAIDILSSLYKLRNKNISSYLNSNIDNDILYFKTENNVLIKLSKTIFDIINILNKASANQLEEISQKINGISDYLNKKIIQSGYVKNLNQLLYNIDDIQEYISNELQLNNILI